MVFGHSNTCTHMHSHTRLMALCPGLPQRAITRKVKPIWILLKQETVSGNGISWAVCKSASRSTQITMPAPDHSVFYRLDAIPAAQPTASKHRRQSVTSKPVKYPWRSSNNTIGNIKACKVSATSVTLSVNFPQKWAYFRKPTTKERVLPRIELDATHLWNQPSKPMYLLSHLEGYWVPITGPCRSLVRTVADPAPWQMLSSSENCWNHTILVKLLAFVDFCVFLGVLVSGWLL